MLMCMFLLKINNFSSASFWPLCSLIIQSRSSPSSPALSPGAAPPSVTDCSICSQLQRDFSTQIIHLSSSCMLSLNIHHCFNGFTLKDTNSSKKLSEQHFTGSCDSPAHSKGKEAFYFSLLSPEKLKNVALQKCSFQQCDDILLSSYTEGLNVKV